MGDRKPDLLPQPPLLNPRERAAAVDRPLAGVHAAHHHRQDLTERVFDLPGLAAVPYFIEKALVHADILPHFARSCGFLRWRGLPSVPPPLLHYDDGLRKRMLFSC